jgi:curved DNA-binding protein
MDYYSILGVPKNASDNDIRKAYKRKSMQHHPDRGGDEEEFKKVNEAYQTLSNAQKRAEYDNPAPQFNFNTSNMGGFEDIFAGFGFGGPQTRQRRNSDVTIQLNLDLKDVFTGKQLVTRYQLSTGKLKEADINIPPGIPEGVGIKFRGLGDDANPHFPPGDLIVRVRIKTPPRWSRSGNDLKTTALTTIFDCLIGGAIEIKTLEDKRLKINIPQGSQPGAVFSVPGHGLPDPNTGMRGNLYVEIKSAVPSINDVNILKELERIKNAIN